MTDLLTSHPTPIEDGAPVRCKVISAGDVYRLAWARDGGRQVEPFGPTYAKPEPACWAAAQLNARAGV